MWFAHCDVDWAGSDSIESRLDDAACKERCMPSADIFGKPYDSECVDQCFMVDVVKEPLDIKL
jgi:hypothetical protein